jgi:nucleotide-binding universal stress UspA family protein
MKILLPVDGSPAALQAVRHALQLVQQGLRADFVLANVQPPANLYEAVTAHDPDVIREVRAAAGADLLAPAEALLQAAGVDFESEVAGGAPEHLIVEIAERYGCDAIVMGARGMGDWQAALLGSVSQAVVQHSPVPVTIVRLADEAAEAGEDSGPEGANED